MDSVIKIEKPHPIKKSNIFSKLFFGWLLSICFKCAKRTLKIFDLYECLTPDKSEGLTDVLEKRWEEELRRCKEKNKDPNLTMVLCKMFFKSYVWHGIVAFIVCGIIKTFQPVILSLFIQQFSTIERGTEDDKLIYGSLLILTTLVIAFFQYQFQFGFSIIGMRMRVACCSLVYRKLLRLSKRSLRETGGGQVVNLLSNDVSRFDLVLQYLHYLWMMPIQVVLLVYLLWKEVGVSSIIGVGTMIVLTLPLQGAIAAVATNLRLKVAKKTDYRIKIMDQMIGGIQVIKMYVWEKALAKIVETVRASEISSLTKFSYLRGIISSMSVFTERLITFVTLISFTLLGNTVTANIVFATAFFHNILQVTVAIYYPITLLFLSETNVTIKRIQQFMMLDEKQEVKVHNNHDHTITLKDVNAYWIPDTPALCQIDIHIPQGTLCAVVGQVGAGKSTFLQLLLGELTSFTGSINVGGDISYSSQDPWIFPSTVRKNILFGQQYHKFRYDNVVDACALKTDFKQFPYRDKTVVGEKGVSLSGGQRARINLARAVYKKADIYLMDDPLSAVDTVVGKFLFEKCILGYLGDKTRILVTHQLQYLKKADHIIVLDNGRVEAQGTFEELSKHTFSFAKLLAAAEESAQEDEHVDRALARASILSVNSENWEEEQLEKNQEGLVNLKKSPYTQYARYGTNVCGLILFGLLNIVSQGITSGCDYWTSFWAQREEQWARENVTGTTEYVDGFVTTNNIMIIYTLFVMGSVLVTSVRAVSFYKIAMNASRRLHGSMFTALLQAPMRFFDSNPMGRILNRFSKDMGNIDEILPRLMLDSLTILMVMVGILVNVSVSNYWMLFACLALVICFNFLLRWYITVARNIRQLEGIAKSPVFSHLNATFNGLTTIRASSTQSILAKEFDLHQDTHTSAWYITIACFSGYGLWVDLLSAIFIVCVTYSFIFMSESGSVSSSAVGLAVQQSMVLVGMLSYGIRQMAEMVSNMIAVERVLEYTELEKEEEDTNKKSYPAIEWPSRGSVVFQDLFLFYTKDDPPVLKNLNFTIEAGEKVGIVGRTGAGKSSLMAALFRLAQLEGHIYIDGVDTRSIPLGELRKRISIIPQVPVLFSETLRYNLDPFNEFDDKKLWEVLEEVDLKDSVSALEMEVDEGGSNFSVGQRQLICLARAILRNNKVLVLDEATANVDLGTDAFVQQTIRKKFRDFTVLTIAHRLNTVIDSDKVLVMDSGRMVEFDHPHLLLQKGGVFHQLIAQTGPSMEAQLHEIARNCYENKNSVISTSL